MSKRQELYGRHVTNMRDNRPAVIWRLSKDGTACLVYVDQALPRFAYRVPFNKLGGLS